MSRPSPTYPRACRVRSRLDFDRAYRQGLRDRRSGFEVCCVPNGLGVTRLGISIGRKAGNAVRRNRIKRVFREAFRLERHSLAPGFDFVVIPRSKGLDPGLAGARAIVAGAFPRLIRRTADRRAAPPPEKSE